MNTRIIVPAIALIFAAICTQASAQAIYYQTSITYHLSGTIALKCDVDPYGGVTLHNPNSKYTYADQTYADGTALPEDIALGDTPVCTMTDASDRDIQSRVNSALTPAEKQSLGDRGFAISVIVHPQTGKVIEVFFWFVKDFPHNKLHPSVFWRIEQNFLSQPQIIDFKVTDVGRKLNYIMFTWEHTFN